MKIAIVHDELMRRGGAEQVVLCFHKAFPEATIYTIAYQPEATYPEFKNCNIKTSWFNKIVKNEKLMKILFFPLGVIAMKQLDVTGFDVVLMSSTYCAKYVKLSPHTVVFNYCHSPFRLAWYPESYAEFLNAKGIKKIAYNLIIGMLQKIDFKAAQRTNYFMTNANEVVHRIKDKYQFNEKIPVIKPSAAIENFYISNEVKDYFLVVCRLEFYKKVDLVIEAFNQLGLPLIVVGKGSKEQELKAIAKSNITFKNGLSANELSKLYAECKGLVFPQVEDYGITPLEAAASGRPVIAFGKGGVLETMIPYKNNASVATALFFDEQTPESLIEAIHKFNSLEFDSKFIRTHAEKFRSEVFIDQIKTYIFKKINRVC
jgi:glycosyltransferase involved in cell wall biosynthesis